MFLNVEEVACRLSVREDTVRHWIEQGVLPAMVPEKRREYWIDEVDLLFFLKSPTGLDAMRRGIKASSKPPKPGSGYVTV